MPRSFSHASLIRALRDRVLPLAALAVTVLACSWPQPAAAQTVVGGANGKPEVEVDPSVLDSLGPAPTLPDLLHSNPSERGKLLEAPAERHRTAAIHLHPPKEKQAKQVAHATAKKHTAQKHTQQKQVQRKHARKHVAQAARPVPKPAVTQATASAAPREKVAATPLPAEPKISPAAAESTAPAPIPIAAAPASLSKTEVPAAPMPAVATSTPAPAASSAVTPPAAPVPAPAAAPVAAISQAAAAPAASPVITPAAAPAALAAGSGLGARVSFAAGSGDLPDSAKSALNAVVQRLKADEQARLQLVAYANGDNGEANQARRLSLTRALAVRTYLMQQGVRNSRMDVRALGNHLDGNGPPDRVDVVVVDR